MHYSYTSKCKGDLSSVMEDDKVSAVVGMVLEEKREIAVFEYNLISAMLDEAALVLERIQKMEDLAESTAK